MRLSHRYGICGLDCRNSHLLGVGCRSAPGISRNGYDCLLIQSVHALRDGIYIVCPEGSALLSVGCCVDKAYGSVTVILHAKLPPLIHGILVVCF